MYGATGVITSSTLGPATPSTATIIRLPLRAMVARCAPRGLAMRGVETARPAKMNGHPRSKKMRQPGQALAHSLGWRGG